MVQRYWSETDEATYDRTGRQPCWAGMLRSATPMVTLCSQWNRWRLNYAPDEATLGQVETYLAAHPCLVVCSGLVKEESHKLVQRWLVLSEFMPSIHTGDLIGGKRRKALLIMEQQHDTEEFSVAEAEVHATVLEFLQGKQVIHVGVGAVAVSEPRSYLKTIGDFKKGAEADFKRLGVDPNYGCNKVVQGQLKASV